MLDHKKYGERIVVGVSGGKDSTATCLHLIERGFIPSDFDRVFIDTGWENKKTYEYLDYLETQIGDIKRIRAIIPIKPEDKDFIEDIETQIGVSSMLRRIVYYSMFPSRVRKWCTTELKLKPLRQHFDRMDDVPLNVVGIRKEESKRRSSMTQIEWNSLLDAYTWRPILDWRIGDVIAIHKRFNVVPNPLYLESSERVGCYPCIMSRKKEIASLDRSRIDLIDRIEKYISAKKGQERTFFHDHNIEIMSQWSKTSRGGKQYSLFSLEEPSCFKWGMCNV